jgi:hypothetical protein
MRGACLLSRRSEDVSIFFGRASVHCEVLLNCWFRLEFQRRFVELFGGRNPPSKRCIQFLVKKLILSFRVTNFLFANTQNTQPHFITGMNANVLHFRSFCKPTFSGATREWDALYYKMELS